MTISIKRAAELLGSSAKYIYAVTKDEYLALVPQTAIYFTVVSTTYYVGSPVPIEEFEGQELLKSFEDLEASPEILEASPEILEGLAE